MSKSYQPLTLRLPFAFADQHLRIEQVLAADRSRSWAQNLPLVAAFALTRPERQFAKRLLQRKRNLWLFRCNQRGFCGDFAVVDMSVRPPQSRPVVVIELKSGALLKFGGGGASNQLQRTHAAVVELVRMHRVIATGARLTMACGDGIQVLEWLERKEPICS